MAFDIDFVVLRFKCCDACIYRTSSPLAINYYVLALLTKNLSETTPLNKPLLNKPDCYYYCQLLLVLSMCLKVSQLSGTWIWQAGRDISHAMRHRPSKSKAKYLFFFFVAFLFMVCQFKAFILIAPSFCMSFLFFSFHFHF